MPKQLLGYRGLPLLQHVIDRAEAAALDELVVVLGHAASEIEEAIELPRNARITVNSAFRSGQASSLRMGLESASPRARAALILLGDQPDLHGEAIAAVLELYRETGGPVVRAEYRGSPGHPVLLDRSVWAETSAGAGDHGAGPILARRPEWVVGAPIELPAPMEVDTSADYARLIANDEETA